MGRGSRTGAPASSGNDPSSSLWLRKDHIANPREYQDISYDPRAAEVIEARGAALEDIPLPEIPGWQRATTLLRLESGSLQLRTKLQNREGRVGLSMVCNIDLQGGIAHHQSIEIDDSLRGRGIGAEILGRQIDFYKKIGIRQIELFANSEIGGYFWARAGFRLPSEAHGAAVRRRIESALGEITRLEKAAEELSLPKEARSDIALAGDLLRRNLQDLDIQEIAALRPSVRLSEDTWRGLSLLSKEEGSFGEAARKILQLRGEAGGYLSGKSLLLGSGWGGVLDLGDPEQLSICQGYLGQSRNTVSAG